MIAGFEQRFNRTHLRTDMRTLSVLQASLVDEEKHTSQFDPMHTKGLSKQADNPNIDSTRGDRWMKCKHTAERSEAQAHLEIGSGE